MRRVIAVVRRVIAEPAEVEDLPQGVSVSGPRPAALRVFVVLLLLSAFVVQAEMRGWWSFGSEEAARDFTVAIRAVTLGGAVLGIEAARQRWRLSLDASAVLSALVLCILGVFVILPDLLADSAEDAVAAIELAGYISVSLTSMFLLRPAGVGTEFSLRSILAGGFILSCGLSVLLLVVVRLTGGVFGHAGFLAGVVFAGFALSLLALRRSYELRQPVLRWVMLVFLALAMSAVARISVLETQRPVASASLALFFGVASVLYASLVELTQTVLVERDRLVLARSETNRAVDRLVEQTRAHHEVAHDTRNAIAAIDGSLQVLGRAPTAEVQAWLADAVRSEMQRLRELIETPRRGQQIMAFDAVEVLKPMMICYQLAEQPVVFVGRKPMWVQGRPGDLAEAVQNLIDNAIRYSSARAIEVEVLADGSRAVVAVRDDGLGIPSAERDRVFENGFRGVGAIGAGSGIGLYVSRSMIVAQQGTLELVDSPSGTEFRITLPSADPVIDLRDSNAFGAAHLSGSSK